MVGVIHGFATVTFNYIETFSNTVFLFDFYCNRIKVLSEREKMAVNCFWENFIFVLGTYFADFYSNYVKIFRLLSGIFKRIEL